MTLHVAVKGISSYQRPAWMKHRKSKEIQKVFWPKWYWDLAKPQKDMSPSTLDVTPDFYNPTNDNLQDMRLEGCFVFYKLPHKASDSEKVNVGSLPGKMFVEYAEDGMLTSSGDEAKYALDMIAQCSYWISAHDCILNQMVVWQQGALAIERTWLTAGNAKKNRVNSELNAMVHVKGCVRQYDIKAHYLISGHDKLCYLGAKEDRYQAALTLQIANLWTWSLFAFKLGMDDLPQGVTFFSTIDIDKVLRKEVDMPCITPSHPDPTLPEKKVWVFPAFWTRQTVVHCGKMDAS
ncbi:uncharacterized protein BJ212DRAFT_1533520 [Suillus subaureus]|uniref:DNA-directed DNA polymerase n=1 Tax=Suillus subaureus TaxID=48587 RepID=A0A9P7EKR2_9AGAM|nr:uncharacterized protein BJ212DRAFT_1533520 [Suillus subaureus]KAG1823737.1 hypothetical protein BJ212DRAFT_1533520 [Suillus subaureus]